MAMTTTPTESSIEEEEVCANDDRQRRHSRLVASSPVISLFVSALFLLCYHVGADNISSNHNNKNSNYYIGGTDVDKNDERSSLFWQRLQAGPQALETLDLVLCAALVLLGFELLDFIIRRSGAWMGCQQIPVRGKHLDDLSSMDLLLIGLSKASVAPFVYFYFRYAYFEPLIVWNLSDLTWQNALLPLVPLFLVFDFFYTIMHGALHLKAVYGWIHKHHHHQKAPSRGNVDAVNVHPVEFFFGEYNHLWSLFLVCQCLKLIMMSMTTNHRSAATSHGGAIHIVAVVSFLVLGGLMAGWNHTRYDIVLRLPFGGGGGGGSPHGGFTIYDSKAHDVHHRIPQSNYGQYTMFWDVVFGTYRPYDPKDRINPDAQLDPKTGKSVGHSAAAAEENGSKPMFSSSSNKKAQ